MMLFVNSYVQTFCATQAAKDAGYSEKTASVMGSRLLRHPACKAEIEQRTQGAMRKVGAAADAALAKLAVTAENIIESLAEMGLAHKAVAKFLKVDQHGLLYYDFTGATPEELAAIQPMLAELTTEQYTEGRGDNKRDVIRSRIKFVERKGVLELLGRYHKLKMWSDTVEFSNVFKDEMTISELKHYAETGEIPERLASRVPKEAGAPWTM